jgi:hypothetical protein
MYVDGEWFSYALENIEKQIPAGIYRVIINRSNRFSATASEKAGHPVDVYLPLLTNVPGHDGIRIHAANWQSQLEGCIAPGFGCGVNYISRSQDAVNELIRRIRNCEELKEDVFLQIG